MLYLLIVAIRIEQRNPCQPSPCGPNSQCREVNQQAVCSCLPEFKGTPPGCRPECVVSSECPTDKSCLNQKCIHPCAGTCGLNTECKVVFHSPICSCRPGHTGDPFTRCYPIPRRYFHTLDRLTLSTFHLLAPPPTPVVQQIVNPCVPSPCGPNSNCRDIGGSPSCSCSNNYIGSPPNCRPECTISSECSSNLACMQEKCKNPCVGACGLQAQCNVINHTPVCVCPDGYTGDPFSRCNPKPLLRKLRVS